MENKAKNLNSRVKALRKKAGLSQEALASLAKISTQTIKDIESGRTEGGRKSLEAISSALGISFEELTGSGTPEPKVIRTPLKISKIATILKTIPDDIYELAAELDDDQSTAWEYVRGILDGAIAKKKKDAQSTGSKQA